MKKSFLIVFALIAVAVLVAACTKSQPEPTPIPAPAPSPTTAPAGTPAVIGMKFGERYHDIHTNKLQLKCESCHVKMTETYYDPLAQVSNPADKRACLSCHKEGSVQPFYGEDWDQAKVRR